MHGLPPVSPLLFAYGSAHRGHLDSTITNCVNSASKSGEIDALANSFENQAIVCLRAHRTAKAKARLLLSAVLVAIVR
jgi:hypothetical protein